MLSARQPEFYLRAAAAALCAASTSWLASTVLQAKGAVLRNCALIGMAAGLAAFFGVSLGGEALSQRPLHDASSATMPADVHFRSSSTNLLH